LSGIKLFRTFDTEYIHYIMKNKSKQKYLLETDFLHQYTDFLTGTRSNKNILLLFIFLICTVFTVHAGYTYTTGTGNPGGLNTEDDYNLSGWTQITFSSSDSSVNQWSNFVNLPSGYHFAFMDRIQYNFQVSRNGVITFYGYTTSGSLPGNNLALPNPSAPRKIIAVFWDQFTTAPPLGTNDKVYYKVFGTSPNRQFWIKWYSHELGASTGYNYFACVLEETTSRIYMVDYGYNDGGNLVSATVGLGDQSDGLQAGNNIQLVLNTTGYANTNNTYYRFTPDPPAAPPTPELLYSICGARKIYYTGTRPYGVDWYWQTSPTGTSMDNSDDTLYATATGTYYLRAYSWTNLKWSTTSTSVTVNWYNAPPPAPSFSTTTNLCGNKTLSLTSAVPADGGVHWQGTSCGTNKSPSSDAEQYNYSATTTGTYYLRAYKWGYDDDMGIEECWSSCTSASIVVNQPPSTPPAPDVSTNLCGPKTITRTTPPGGVIYYWQTASSDTSKTNSSLTYTANSSGTVYLKARTTAGCWSPGVSASATVNPNPSAPAIPTVSSNDCGTKTITRTNPPSGETYYWQSTSSGTSTLNSSLTISVTVSNTYYIRSLSSAGCWSDYSSVAVQYYSIPDAPPVPTATPLSLCDNKTLTRANPPLNVTYYWQTSPGGTSITTTNKNLYVTDPGIYYLRAQSNDGGCWSDTATSILVEIQQPYEEKICIVTVDPPSGKNFIVWEKTPDKGTEYFTIYRETNTANVYAPVGTIPYSDTSVFLDITSTPENQQHIYKITSTDTCGHEYDVAIAEKHKTMFLVQTGTVGGVNLSWSKYQVNGTDYSFDSYIIYRGSDSGTLSPIDTISGSLNLYTDTRPDALIGIKYYRVAGLKTDGCRPQRNLKANSGPFSQAISNLEDNRLKGETKTVRVNDPAFTVYPNPANDKVTVEYVLNADEFVSVELLDITGRIVKKLFSERQLAGTHILVIENLINELVNGIYFVSIKENKKPAKVCKLIVSH